MPSMQQLGRIVLILLVVSALVRILMLVLR
jgi:hypothetical protein